MSKDSFMFFRNMRDVIKQVPKDKQLELREAIEDFVFDGIESEDWTIRAIVQSLKPSLEFKGVGAPKGNNNNPYGRNGKSKEPIKSIKTIEPIDNQQEPIKSIDNQLNQLNQLEPINQEAKAKAKTKTETKVSFVEPSPEKEFPDNFEKFWYLYPKTRAGSKEKAFKAYLRCVPSKITHERLMSVVKSYALSKEVKDGFACGCERWFNAEKFNDTAFQASSADEEECYVHDGVTYYGAKAKYWRERDAYNPHC